MKQLVSLLTIFILVSSCSKDEEYPFDQSPYVEFEDLVYTESTENFQQHRLEMSFVVWDREGDVGLSPDQIGYPYHQYDAVLDADGNLIGPNSNFNPPFTIAPSFYGYDEELRRFRWFVQTQFAAEFAMSEYPELSCKDYAITDDSNNPEFLGFVNRNHTNLFIKFLDADNVEIDFRQLFAIAPDENCGLGFDARLVRLDPGSFLVPTEIAPFQITKVNKYAYRVKYTMSSLIFRIAFRDQQFGVQFQVADREFNESNVASTGLVFLEEITIE